ncbi:MAG: hypothetical protein CL607_21905 [Anaerolineaceae bacterium]|nr:hypothetical protein [Anaerolineaceae bacterium]
MQFKEGATVYTSNGDTVGDIERFVIDPRDHEVIGLVVRKGFLFTEDRVVPVDMVKESEEDRVTLATDRRNADDFPVYKETHYVTPEEADLADRYTRTTTPTYYYPPYGVPMWFGAGRVPYAEPVGVEVEERNIPAGSVALKEGANVISLDDKHVGDVERVYTDANSDITHFAITQGLLFKDEKVLPLSWVSDIRDDEVHLAVTAKTLEQLNTRSS